MSRVLVVGLDCVPPHLAFGSLAEVMPTLSRLCRDGAYGPLRSTSPPITVPAWATMTTGRDPGELGLYGFRNRVPGTYALELVTSDHVREKRIWDYVGDAGKRSVALFVPPTWPPPPIRGALVSCFLTPGADVPHTHPPKLEGELTRMFGPYLVDAEGFRDRDPASVLASVRAMTTQHFAIATHLLQTERPDFAMMVEIGPDRVHHALYPHVDPAHPSHDAAHPLAHACREYYAQLDRGVATLITAMDEPNVLVVSDHGARPLEGGVRINEWLRREGYLTLLREPEGAIQPTDVDWSRTIAIGEGGYYGRVFLNVKGRDPSGIVERYDATRDEIAQRFLAMCDEEGRAMGNVVHFPERVYRQTRGAPPDLAVYFGNLARRSLGTLGEDLFPRANDTGHDACNHDWDGIFAMSGPDVKARGPLAGLEIADVASTALSLLGIEVSGLSGRDRSRE